jgi:hypothetical protein
MLPSAPSFSSSSSSSSSSLLVGGGNKAAGDGGSSGRDDTMPPPPAQLVLLNEVAAVRGHLVSMHDHANLSYLANNHPELLDDFLGDIEQFSEALRMARDFVQLFTVRST